jgi:raffinose/stachyose/melibiose transport system substrate-binding protein
MKRVFVLLAAFVLAGCSSTATPVPTPVPTPAAPTATPVPGTTLAPTATPAPTKENVTLEVMASQDWIKSSEQVLAGRFEEQTGIHLDFQIIPSAQYFNVLQTKLQSGQGVDLFLGQAGVSDMTLTYNAPTNAVDLSNESWVQSLDPVVASQSTVDKKLYGAEVWDVVGANYWVMSYNKAIFAKYNLTPPKTFADFETVCATLLQNGITPIYEPISDGWHHVLWFPTIGGQMEALEPGLYDKLNANQTTFAADANASTAITQLNDLYQKGYFGKSALSAKEADTSKQMAGGQYAMTLSEISRGTQIAAAFPTFKATDFGYFPDPILDNQLQPAHPAGPTWMIDSKSSHVAEAKEWLDFMTSPDNLQWLINNTPDFETLPFTGVTPKWDASQQAFFDTYKEASVPVLQDGVSYVNPQWMLMGQDFTSMFTGKATPAKVLQLIDTERTKEAKTAKDQAWP